MRFCVLNILLTCISICNGFNALIAVPYSPRSLHGLFSAIAKELGQAGHNVTFISPYEMSHPNVKMLQVKQFKNMVEDMKVFELRTSQNLTIMLGDILSKVVPLLYSDERVMELWRRRKDFDVFLTPSYFNEFTFPFLMDSSAIFVQVCTPGIEMIALSREGNWVTPAVIPSILNEFDENMSFWERFLNLPTMISYYFLQAKTFPVIKTSLADFFPSLTDPDSYYDRVALTLINGHFALDGPVPLLPSQIEIGTINAKKPQPLSKDLEDFMQSSGDAGVIYFSLGSIAKSTDIPQEAKEMFVEAFRRVPQRVLWKYEGTDLQMPPNVKAQSWMPQQDILGHPKTRVFISHCGNLGTQEAKYHGVPTLAIPIAFDQPRNAARMERKGYAIVLNWDDLSTEKIVVALDKLINDSSYQECLKSVSTVLQDQKETPAQRAVWWLEYVVRHKGAPHLEYAGKRLSLFQYIMLDVILFWTAVIMSVLFLNVYIVKQICCKRKDKIDLKRSIKKRL